MNSCFQILGMRHSLQVLRTHSSLDKVLDYHVGLHWLTRTLNLLIRGQKWVHESLGLIVTLVDDSVSAVHGPSLWSSDVMIH